MDERQDPSQLLLDLARTEGADVVHLPYSPQFEALCRQIKPSPKTLDKHAIWERLLELRSSGDRPPPPPEPPASGTRSAAPTSSAPPRLTTRPQESGLLFHVEPPIPELQPWALPPEPALSTALADQRAKLLADIATSRIATYEQRVARILERHPETRESDIALCIRYWREFQADVIEHWQPLELEILFELDRMDTLGRTRRFVQNDLRLFRGMEDTRRARDAMQREFHEYIAAHRDTLPEVRFYLDETGNEGDKAYTGIAGVCVLNWRQYEKHHAAMELWRRKQGWPEAIHFADTGAGKMDRVVALLQQLAQRRSGLLFLGYAIASRGRTQEAMFSLFIQLVLDSIRHLHRNGCLADNRSIRVIKEAEPGFDSIFLEEMTNRLEEMITLEFPGQLAVLPVEAVTKGRNVLLECADLIAGGMQRRALGKGRNPKDRVAEAVINLTGFEDGADTGALFKYFGVGR